MIEPPQLFTDARFEYDIQDLEILSKLAIETGVHSNDSIRSSFEKLVQLAGTKQFQQAYVALHNFLLSAYERQNQYVWTVPKTKPASNGNYVFYKDDYMTVLEI
eukprot:Colp12_sorted_trinity150504_noHs@21801